MPIVLTLHRASLEEPEKAEEIRLSARRICEDPREFMEAVEAKMDFFRASARNPILHQRDPLEIDTFLAEKWALMRHLNAQMREWLKPVLVELEGLSTNTYVDRLKVFTESILAEEGELRVVA